MVVYEYIHVTDTVWIEAEMSELRQIDTPTVKFVSEKINFTVNGSIEGIISEKPAGDEGFGYDPIFFVPEYNKTFAQLPEKIKDRKSVV